MLEARVAYASFFAAAGSDSAGWMVTCGGRGELSGSEQSKDCLRAAALAKAGGRGHHFLTNNSGICHHAPTSFEYLEDRGEAPRSAREARALPGTGTGSLTGILPVVRFVW